MKRRVLILALAALLAVAMGASATGTREAASTVTTVTQLCWDRGQVPSAEGDITKNWYTDFVNQKVAALGLKVEFKPVQRNKEAEILPTLLAAGNAPDICYSYDKNLIVQFALDGGLVDFGPLMDQKSARNLLGYYRSEDLKAGQVNGGQFMFRYMNTNDGTLSLTWIRQDWLDSLGLAVPTDLDSFTAMLRAFKTKDPGGKGAKTVPWAVKKSTNYWDNNVMPAFVKDKPVGEKMAVPSPLWPEAKDALRYMNQCYNEGLLGDLILDKDDTLFKQKFVLGEMGALTDVAHWPFHSAYGELYKNLQKNVPQAKIVPATPFRKASEENWVALFRSEIYTMSFFSPKNKTPEAAKLAYMDWLASPECVNAVLYGVEGRDFEIKDNMPVKLESWNKKVSWLQPQYGNVSMRAFWDRPEIKLPTEMDFPPYQQLWLSANPMARRGDHPWARPEINAPTPMAVKYTAQITSEWNNALPKIVTAAPGKFNAVFDAAVAEYRRNGGDAVEKEARELYRKIYGK